MVIVGSYYESGEQWEELNPYEQMIMDYVGPSNDEHIENMKENPNPQAQKFFNMLAIAQASLWEGCDNHSKLSISLAALSLKFDYSVLEGCFNQMVQLMGETMPKSNKMKVGANLGLGYLRIDCCKKLCMLYYNENSNKTLTKCFVCKTNRYMKRKILLRKCGTFHSFQDKKDYTLQ
ncbi:hypothetical protein CR513_54271, partial [Mucuna pruriens]